MGYLNNSLKNDQCGVFMIFNQIIFKGKNRERRKGKFFDVRFLGIKYFLLKKELYICF